MPELPEVETIRRHLAPVVVGRRLGRVEVLDPRWTAPAAPEETADSGTGDLDDLPDLGLSEDVFSNAPAEAPADEAPAAPDAAVEEAAGEEPAAEEVEETP